MSERKRPARSTRAARPSYVTDPFKLVDKDNLDLSDMEDTTLTSAAHSDEDDDDGSVHLSDEGEDGGESEDDGFDDEEDEDNASEEDFDEDEDDERTSAKGKKRAKKGDKKVYTRKEPLKTVSKRYFRNQGVKFKATPNFNTTSAHFSLLKSRKKTRIQSTFTTSTTRLIEGVQARDRWADLPLAPERRRLLSRGSINTFAGEKLDVSCQLLETLSSQEDVSTYFPGKCKDSVKVVMGSQGQEVNLTFPAFGTHSLDKSLPGRKGWLVNCGGECSAIKWVSGPKEEGKPWYQYLIIGTRSPGGGNIAFPPDGIKKGGKTCLQVWRFSASHDKGQIDMGEGNGSVVALVCGEWGGTLCIETLPGEDARPDYFAVVGIIGEDGSAQILEIPLPTHPSSQTSAYKLIRPAYILPPPPPHAPGNPSPFYTCLSFPSRNGVHAGLSNGYLASFTLPLTVAIPTFYHPIHASLVLGITSASPKIAVTTSMDGYSCVTNLAHPNSPINSLRSRVASPIIRYSRPLNSVALADDQSNLKLLPLPRFQGGVLIAKHPHGGSIRDVAVSSQHTYLCSVGWEGTVMLCNGVRKLFQAKIRGWQVPLFRVGYSPKLGLIRIWDGWKAEEVIKREGEKGEDGEAVVWEAESAVLSAQWNCGADAVAGWCAVGLQCGLVRVEDLCVEDEDVEREKELRKGAKEGTEAEGGADEDREESDEEASSKKDEGGDEIE